MTNQTHFHFKLLVWMSNKRLGKPDFFHSQVGSWAPKKLFCLKESSYWGFRVVLSPTNSQYHFVDSHKVPASQALFNESGPLGKYIYIYTRWWLNHPFEKYARQIGSWNPNFRCENKKNIGNHQPWYPQIINFNRVFHYKPSILGYHYFRNPPYIYIYVYIYIHTMIPKPKFRAIFGVESLTKPTFGLTSAEFLFAPAVSMGQVYVSTSMVDFYGINVGETYQRCLKTN